MSTEESFLARWARRKRAGSTKTRGEPKPKHAGNDAAPEPAAIPLAAGETPSLVDPESLPPIETIGAGSDIRPFLASGVPAELTRAALRRAWSADPAIRDFIGLSENSWDFNMPGGVPGFGSLAIEDIRRLLEQSGGKPKALDASSHSDQPRSGPVPDQVKLVPDGHDDRRRPVSQDETSDIAMQQKCNEREAVPTLPRRRHGGALPD
jgi:hypothetical protein